VKTIFQFAVLLVLLLAAPVLPAQQDHTHHEPATAPDAKTSDQPANGAAVPVESADSQQAHGSGHQAEHAHAGSGTSWQPKSVPVHMWSTQRGAWTLAAHGNLFLTFNHQGGPRGRGKLESMNWLMLSQQRKVGSGTLEFRQMFSGEPLTAPHGGFPQLFQTGETYRGAPVVDAQHPHDVFGELSLTWRVPVTERVSLEFYGAPVGEPALGPPTFMHRASVAELPAAPLGHHLQDSTHISAGVVTSGLIVGPFKGEISLFNGREPDEVRHTIDFAPMDSWSFRLNLRPGRNWALQYSRARLREPEALEEGDITRQTASVSYNRPLARGHWATTLLWGRNHKHHEGTNQNSYLLESTLNFQARNYAYTRLELLDRDELFPALPHPQPQFRVGAYTFGGVRDLVQNAKLQVGLGADVTFYSKPAALDAFYGENPVSFRVFLRFRPGLKGH